MAKTRRGYELALTIITFKNGLIPLIIANFILLFIGIFTWNYYDVRYFIEWVDVAKRYGILYIYEYARKAAYPPLPIIVFTVFHWISSSVTHILPLIRFIDKIPLLISYNLIYYLLLKKYGLRPALYWLSNFVPYIVFFIYQFDLLSALFILLAAYEFSKPARNPFKTALYISLAVLCKQLLIVLALIPLIVYYKEGRIKDLYKYIVSGTIIGLTAILPFLLVDPYMFLNKILFYHSRRYPQELSIWAIPLYLYNYDYTKLPSWITSVWLPFFIIFLGLIFYKLSREKSFESYKIMRYFALVILISLITNKVNNLNYLTWVLPLIIIIITTSNGRYNKLRLLNVSVPWIVGILFSLTTFYAAAVVYGSVLLIEDLSYYSALWLMERSVDQVVFIFAIIDYLRLYFYDFFLILYKGMGISATIYVLIYNAFLIYNAYIFKKDL